MKNKILFTIDQHNGFELVKSGQQFIYIEGERQSGKSTFGYNVALLLGKQNPNENILFYTVTDKFAKQVANYFKENETFQKMNLTTNEFDNITISCPSKMENIIGKSFTYVVIDNAGYIDKETINEIFPHFVAMGKQMILLTDESKPVTYMGLQSPIKWSIDPELKYTQ